MGSFKNVLVCCGFSLCSAGAVAQIADTLSTTYDTSTPQGKTATLIKWNARVVYEPADCTPAAKNCKPVVDDFRNRYWRLELKDADKGLAATTEVHGLLSNLFNKVFSRETTVLSTVRIDGAGDTSKDFPLIALAKSARDDEPRLPVDGGRVYQQPVYFSPWMLGDASARADTVLRSSAIVSSTYETNLIKAIVGTAATLGSFNLASGSLVRLAGRSEVVDSLSNLEKAVMSAGGFHAPLATVQVISPEFVREIRFEQEEIRAGAPLLTLVVATRYSLLGATGTEFPRTPSVLNTGATNGTLRTTIEEIPSVKAWRSGRGRIDGEVCKDITTTVGADLTSLDAAATLYGWLDLVNWTVDPSLHDDYEACVQLLRSLIPHDSLKKVVLDGDALARNKLDGAGDRSLAAPLTKNQYVSVLTAKRADRIGERLNPMVMVSVDPSLKGLVSALGAAADGTQLDVEAGDLYERLSRAYEARTLQYTDNPGKCYSHPSGVSSLLVDLVCLSASEDGRTFKSMKVSITSDLPIVSESPKVRPKVVRLHFAPS